MGANYCFQLFFETDSTNHESTNRKLQRTKCICSAYSIEPIIEKHSSGVSIYIETNDDLAFVEFILGFDEFFG